MKIKEYKSYDVVCWDVVRDIQNRVVNSQYFNLGLATGSTPIGIYEQLRKMDVDFKKTLTYNLDEYVGLDKSHPQSYKYFMNEHLFKHKEFHSNNFPDEKLCPYYDSMIDNSDGIDIQILGIGTNGHIAFNEPGTPRDSVTRIVDLTESTIKDNSRFFDSIKDVPKQAITMGIKSIMSAKKIYLLANGKHKKEILEKSVYGEITSEIPASFLQEHKNTEVLYCE